MRKAIVGAISIFIEDLLPTVDLEYEDDKVFKAMESNPHLVNLVRRYNEKFRNGDIYHCFGTMIIYEHIVPMFHGSPRIVNIKGTVYRQKITEIRFYDPYCECEYQYKGKDSPISYLRMNYNDPAFFDQLRDYLLSTRALYAQYCYAPFEDNDLNIIVQFTRTI